MDGKMVGLNNYDPSFSLRLSSCNEEAAVSTEERDLSAPLEITTGNNYVFEEGKLAMARKTHS